MLLSREPAKAVRQRCALLAVVSQPCVKSPYCTVEFPTDHNRCCLPPALRKDFMLLPILLSPPREFSA
jgi:hypothetical protein